MTARQESGCGSLPVPPLTGRGPRTRRLRRLTMILLLLVVSCAWAWIQRDSLLQGVADLWIVSDSVTHADAVVVLGGGLGGRPSVAAEFYKNGLVNRILISEVSGDRETADGVVQGQTESNREVLLKLGVPAN